MKTAVKQAGSPKALDRLSAEAAMSECGCTAPVCAHCRLPVPRAGPGSGERLQFCCRGCETAHELIRSCGLDRYYSLLERWSEVHQPSRRTNRAYAEFDDPTFVGMYCRPLERGLLQAELLLEGVHCGACVWLLEKLPSVLLGVRDARVDVRRAAATITFDPTAIELSRIGRTLDSLGFPPHPARNGAAREVRRREDRRMLARVAVAGACAGNIMLLFFALYAGLFEGMDPDHEKLFRWTSLALNSACLAWPGLVFARGAWASLRAGSIGLDVPIALGLYLGGIWGAWKTVSGSGDIYFDSISALVFFLLVGRFIQQRQQRAAADSIERLFSVTPAIARRVGTNGAVTDVPIEAVVPGDIVEVRPGDSAPADGRVVDGQSEIDLSVLSGESRPVRVRVGDELSAGAVNLSSRLLVQVEHAGESTRVGRLMRMVEEAASRRAPIVKVADQWGRRLLWAILLLACATLAWWWSAGPSVAIDHAVALLIVTCPCGLGLATPLAMTVAIGRAAKRGILIKGGDSLQSLAGPQKFGTLVLDKTGTITHGRVSVVRRKGDALVWRLVAALEAGSPHPIAAALRRDSASDKGADLVVDRVVQHLGAGVEGTVDGRRLIVGTRSLLESRGIAIDPNIESEAQAGVREGLSPVFVAVNGRCAGVAALGDPIRPDSVRAVAAIRRLGWNVKICSGDHYGIVEAVGCHLGIETKHVRGSATPELKVQHIHSLLAGGPVIMVGDGVNDAAALATSTVGIAVRGGAEASLAAADVSLAEEGLWPVVELLEGARATMRTIRWTLASSLTYNALAASLCVAGLISPLLAAIVMPASSLSVVAICVGGRAFKRQHRRQRNARDSVGSIAERCDPEQAETAANVELV